MRKTSLRLTFDEFDDTLTFYAGFVSRIVAAQRVIRFKYEKQELLEAFVLRLVTLWDVFAEDLLAACLNRDTSRYAQSRGLKLRKHLSADECQAMLTGLAYLDFKRVGEVQGVAKQVLVLNPFNAIPKATAKKIDELMIMRNYLSHYSGKSKRALEKVYRDTYRMKTFREPGAFLWANTQRGGRIRFAVYIQALAEASAEMRKALGKHAK